MAHGELYVVDNINEKSSVKKYLNECCYVSKEMIIAAGVS